MYSCVQSCTVVLSSGHSLSDMAVTPVVFLVKNDMLPPERYLYYLVTWILDHSSGTFYSLDIK